MYPSICLSIYPPLQSVRIKLRFWVHFRMMIDIKIILSACFTANPEHSTISTDVIVDVIDSNDNCPKFVDETNSKCHTEIQVIQGQPSGSIVAIISASDPDAHENGDITYALINGQL
jgi:hypothetical protein